MVNVSGGDGGQQTATIAARQRVNSLLEFNKWVAFAKNFLSDPEACSKCVTQLNEHFLKKVVLVGGGYTPSEADIIVFSTVHPYKAIFPEKHWPLGFKCNGHSMLNCQKVSKLTGNFRTLKQAIDDFSTDATRFSLADAGDALKSRFYDLQAVRDEYRVFCGLSGMNCDLLLWTRLVAPVCPHYSEYVWRKLLNKEGFVINAG
nr:leucine--tRNA ligase, cytoplasmic [Tanacetum cinerariifolium]